MVTQPETLVAVYIKVTFWTLNTLSFLLELHFEPTNYFTSPLRTKTCAAVRAKTMADPFSFGYSEICTITGL